VTGSPPGLYPIVGTAAVLAATTQGPVSTAVLMIEFKGYGRSFIVPLLIAVSSATLIFRWIEPRSINNARLSEQRIEARIAQRSPSTK